MRVAASRSLAVASALSVVLASCGGGGRSVPPPLQPQPSGAATGSAQFVLTIPPKTTAAHRRRPAYVSPATQSLTIAFANNGPTYTMALSASSPNCVQQPSTSLVCTITASPPAGSWTVTVLTFASTDGTGTPLSRVTVPVTIVGGQENTVDLVLDGVATAVELVDTDVPRGTVPRIHSGSATTLTLAVNAYDAGGALIVGPGSYSDKSGNPITFTLTDSDTSGATSVAPTTVSDPSSNLVKLTYNGGAISSVHIDVGMVNLGFGSSLTIQVTSAPGGAVQSVFVEGFSNCPGSGSIPRATTQVSHDAVPSSGTTMGPMYAFFTLPQFEGHGISVTRSGADLFIADYAAPTGSVEAFVTHFSSAANGSNPPPTATISLTGVHYAAAVAADSSAGVWVTVTTPPSDAVEVRHYPPGANGGATPDRVVSGIVGLPPGLTIDPASVAVDSHDNLYVVADEQVGTQAAIYELPPTANGSAVTPTASYPFDKSASNLTSNPPGRVAIDQHTNTVWESPANIYAGETTTPPTPGATPIADTGMVAFPNGSSTPSRVLETGMGTSSPGFTAYPKSLAVDDSGNVYVVYGPGGYDACVNSGAFLTVYSAAQSGHVTPASQETGDTAVAIPPFNAAP